MDFRIVISFDVKDDIKNLFNERKVYRKQIKSVAVIYLGIDTFPLIVGFEPILLLLKAKKTTELHIQSSLRLKTIQKDDIFLSILHGFARFARCARFAKCARCARFARCTPNYN